MFDIKNIKDPSFLKKLSKKELKVLASEIREFLIQNVSETGGHLASNLGVVEVTIAMHYVFDSPNDKLLFDVGHQSYVHKILTGRANEFSTLRKTDGLSGYINCKESIHDIWESGHSSTSISAQAGMIASEKYVDNGRIVCLIGDSSIANGVAFEGLNFEGQFQNSRPIIILNDNKMGINKSVGALTKFLNKMRGTKFLRAYHITLVKILPRFITNFFHKIKRGIKGFIQADNIFEDLGFDYYGPYEGNEITGLIQILKKAKSSKTPCIIHIITRKGQGYKPAEERMTYYHGVAPFDPLTGEAKSHDNKIIFSEIVANSLIEERKEKVFILISPAMLSASCLNKFKERYPSDCYDVGIAEEHATVMACGIALSGVKAVVAMYSTFSQRAFDYLLNDVSRQNLSVLFLFDRAGIVGEDGSTHQGIYDIAMLSLMPNMTIAMGKNPSELKGLLHFGLNFGGPFVLRYPKLKVLDDSKQEDIFDMNWVVEKEGNKKVIISYGPDIERILSIVNDKNLDIGVINARFIRPLDTVMLDKLGKSKIKIYVYEQVIETSSLGMMIINYFAKNGYDVTKVKTMSINTSDIVEHGKINEVLDKYHIGDKDILSMIEGK